MTKNIQTSLLKMTQLHFVYIGVIAAQIIVFDSWKLLAPTAVLQRWAATALMLAVVTGIWYMARPGHLAQTYRRLIGLLLFADLAFASFVVYNQRGMASRGVALYAVPIIVAGILRSRTAIFATATIAMASYVTAAISYFVLHFNEGYKIELYGEVGFYAACFLVLAGLVALVTDAQKS